MSPETPAAPERAPLKKTTANKPTARKPARKPAAKPSPKRQLPIRDIDKAEYFFNRELSWLEFNARVLEEAQDESNPLLERLKFLTIVSSNMDEFFEIRVAGLQQQAESNPGKVRADGLAASEMLKEIAGRVRRMIKDQYACYARVVRQLEAEGVELKTTDELDAKGQAWCRDYFENEVFPVLTPLAIDPAHPFPQLLNKSLNLAVVLHIPNTPGKMDGMRHDENHESERFAVVQVPRMLPRLVEMPSAGKAGSRRFVFLSSIISSHVDQLFPGLEVQGCYSFRITRNGELYLDEDEADNLLDAVRLQLQQRRRGDAVRLEVQRGCDPEIIKMLLDTFELEAIDLYEVDGPVNLTRMMAIYSAVNRPDLKDAPFKAGSPAALANVENDDEFFGAIAHKDILLHHPYESFRTVIEFLTRAANDPKVLAIKTTLYRTSSDSPIIKALMRAAENGKQVTVVVELKARFDEENNIQWARAMEEAGVHVLYGLVGLKTHSKLALVVRREAKGIRRYIHLGTGNYNEVTARFYTDLGMLTGRQDQGEDAAKIFNLLTGMSQFPGLEKLRMAPFGLHEHFIKLVERETAHAKKLKRTGNGKGKNKIPAPRIIAKMNALEEPNAIKALYRASQAGVQIDLIVRGICCLRPGVPGLSDNIRVRCIIDRFLEHSRAYYFENNGQPEIYCGSADWMPRNFFRRVEVLFPVEDKDLQQRMLNEVLLPALADNTKARLVNSDGSHRRAQRGPDTKPLRYQQWLIQHTTKAAREKPATDMMGVRPVASPSLAAAQVLRPVQMPLSPPSADGRAGTSADPVLQSLQQSLSNEDETSVNGAPPLPPPTSNGSKPPKALKSVQPKRAKA